MNKKIISGLLALSMLVMIAGAATAAKGGNTCTTIQSGEILASDGSTIVPGYDDWGYNYQAHMFNGLYCDSHRDAA